MESMPSQASADAVRKARRMHDRPQPSTFQVSCHVSELVVELPLKQSHAYGEWGMLANTDWQFEQARLMVATTKSCRSALSGWLRCKVQVFAMRVLVRARAWSSMAQKASSHARHPVRDGLWPLVRTSPCRLGYPTAVGRRPGRASDRSGVQPDSNTTALISTTMCLPGHSRTTERSRN